MPTEPLTADIIEVHTILRIYPGVRGNARIARHTHEVAVAFLRNLASSMSPRRRSVSDPVPPRVRAPGTRLSAPELDIAHGFQVAYDGASTPRRRLLDREGRIIAGNKTVEEGTKLGLPIRVVASTGAELVVVHRTDLDLTTDARARTLALADNRVAELDLEWDPEMLQQHLADGVEMGALWTAPELERVLGEGLHPGATADDHTAQPRETDIARGELFEMGAHRVLCGDATDAADVTTLLGHTTPALMVTDPPYGVGYQPSKRPHTRGG